MILLKRCKAIILSIMVGGLLFSSVGVAEEVDTYSNAEMVNLLKKIELRDQAIRDLQHRVAELERQRKTPPVARPTVAAKPAPKQEAPATTRHAPAPGQFEVDEDAAERALERTLVQAGALLLPSGVLEVEPNLSYTRWELGVPALFDIEGEEFIVADENVRRNIVDADVQLRLGLPYDSQLEIGLPYRWVDESVVTNIPGIINDKEDRNDSGFGDIRIGLAKTLVREGLWRPDLVARLTWDTDTGDTSDAIDVSLGDGFNSLSLGLSAVKRQDPLAFIGSFSYRKTFEKDDIEPGQQFGLALGAALAASPETSLRFVLSQSFESEAEVNDWEVSGSDQISGNLTLGASTILGRGLLLDVSTDIGLTDDAPDYSLRLSISKRYNL